MMRARLFVRGLLLALTLATIARAPIGEAAAESPKRNTKASSSRLKVLFLGDDRLHNPAERCDQVLAEMAGRGVDLFYTEDVDELNTKTLSRYDCLLIYANHPRINPEQEQALLQYVENGGGLAAIHCASYCFHNADAYVDLVGAQFKSHGTGTFTTERTDVDHPILQGVDPIESWDETYVHHRHNKKNRTVLSYRRGGEQAEGREKEPWTWVRSHGEGRVFYTAWGHDQRTWGNKSFQNLLERGIRWAAGDGWLDRKFTPPPFEFAEAGSKIPFYPAGESWGTTGDPLTRMQKPLEPAASVRHMAVPGGFEVELFAAEPRIVNPICMKWDERGRLWIAETMDYPNDFTTDEGRGRDRIRILEDTDGDGQADEFTVFAKNLSLPTSFVFANSGVVITAPPRTLFLKDTDGDDKADVRRTLFTGWSTDDTHAGPSNLRYGPDNWIWGTVGYAGFDGNVGGERVRFRTGIFRMKPDGSAIEFVRSTTNNTWGLGFNEAGDVFASTANGDPSFYMPIANRYYERVRGWSAGRLASIADSDRFHPVTERVRQVDHHGRYTAGAGHAVYTARTFPEKYWNRYAFVTGPTGHLIGQFELQPDGAGYTARNRWHILAGRDEWSAPIAAEVGPDGQLWFIDWYNYIIQHNPTPEGFETGKGNAYESDLRDRSHGRIYRLVYNNEQSNTSESGEPFSLTDASPQKLVDTLNHPNMLWRLHAQRLLVERGKLDVIPELAELVQSQETDAVGLNPGTMHALWALQGLGSLDGNHSNATQAAFGSLDHPSPDARRAALRVLPNTVEAARRIIEGKLLEDRDPRVRKAALLAFSETPAFEEAGPAIYAALKDERNRNDKWILDAATAAAARHDAGFLRAVLSDPDRQRTAAQKKQPKNLITNGSFEALEDNAPVGWRSVQYSGRATFTVAPTGRTGGRSVRIQSDDGADASWSFTAEVKPNTRYRLTAWVRTENLDAGSGRGAQLNLHQLGHTGRTEALTGTTGWTRLTSTFNSGENDQLQVNCLFGGWGQSTGTAFFDGITLKPAASPALAGKLGNAIQTVTGHYAAGGPSDSILETLRAVKQAEPALAAAILDGLAAGWPDGQAPSLNEGDRKNLTALLEELPTEPAVRLFSLLKTWESAEGFEDAAKALASNLRGTLQDGQAPTPRRIEAANQLVELRDSAKTAEAILSQIRSIAEPALVQGLIRALATSERPGTGAALLKRWPKLTPAMQGEAIRALLNRDAWAKALLRAIEAGRVDRSTLGPPQWLQLKRHNNETIASLAKEVETGSDNAGRKKLVQRFLKQIDPKAGDPANGKTLYTQNCAVCHRIDGEGGHVGPDLNGIGQRPVPELMVAILDPNRSVEGTYRLWTVTTEAGRSLAGRLAAETRTSIELIDLAGQSHTVQRSDIAQMNAAPVSVMPEGFERLGPDGLSDLLTYLKQQAEGEE